MHIKNLNDCPEYLNTIAEWWQNEWGHYNPNRTLDDRKRQLQNYLSPAEQLPSVWLAFEGDTLLGTVALDIDDLPSVDHGFTPWLASVYVHPDYRRQGIGRLLVEYAIQFAREQDYDNVTLFTDNQMQWYEGMGFKVIDKNKYSGYDITIMQINLKERP